MNFLHSADTYIELYIKYYHSDTEISDNYNQLDRLYQLSDALKNSPKDTELEKAVWTLIETFYPLSYSKNKSESSYMIQ